MRRPIVISESLLVMVTVIWGLGFPITKLAVEAGFGPFSVILARFLISSIIIATIYRKKLKFLNKQVIKLGIITGIFLFFGFYFQTLGAVYTTPSKNGFITQLNIVFVPFLYVLFTKKTLGVNNLLAVAIALTGLYLIAFQGGSLEGANRGDVYTLICAVLVAFHVVTSSHFQKQYDLDPYMFVLVSMITAMIMAFVLVPFENVPTLTIANAWPLVFLGIFNTALGFSVQSYALKVSHPARISLIVALEGLFGAIGSVLIIKEVLSIHIVLGGMLIILGILLTELKEFKSRRIKEKTV